MNETAKPFQSKMLFSLLKLIHQKSKQSQLKMGWTKQRNYIIQVYCEHSTYWTAIVSNKI